MTLISATQQPLLFRHGDKRLLLQSKEIKKDAPNWIMENAYALKCKEKELIHFQIKKKLTEREQLLERCEELDIVVGDEIKIANMEQLIAQKEKELEDAKK